MIDRFVEPPRRTSDSRHCIAFSSSSSSLPHPDQISITMKSITIALATAKEAIRQPAFFVMAFFAAALLIVTIFVSYFTFGEDIKMYKDTGLTTISFFCMLLALLTASSTVADEIEGKTAITLLSKPITRRQFIVGKFLGIELGVLALYVVLGALFAAGVWYKYAYDLRESAGGVAESAKRWDQVHAGDAWAGTRVFRGDGSHGDQRGDFDAVADAGESGGLHPGVLPGPPEPGSGGGCRPDACERSGELHGEVVCVGAAVARVFQRRSIDFNRCGHSVVRLRFACIAVYCMLYSGAALLLAFIFFEDRDLA